MAPLKKTTQVKKMGLKKSGPKKTGPKKMTSTKKVKNPAKADGEMFNLEKFIDLKLKKPGLEKKNEKLNISGSRNSSLADLVKFNTGLAHSRYKITDEDR